MLTTQSTSRLLFNAITFSGTGRFFNLSRHDPAKVSHGIGNKNNYFHANGGNLPITFVSTIVVSECHLIEPRYNKANGRSLKTIAGACIEGEMERMVGAIGQIINEAQYKAQIEAGNISFSTSLSSGDAGMSRVLPMSMYVNLQIYSCSFLLFCRYKQTSCQRSKSFLHRPRWRWFGPLMLRYRWIMSHPLMCINWRWPQCLSTMHEKWIPIFTNLSSTSKNSGASTPKSHLVLVLWLHIPPTPGVGSPSIYLLTSNGRCYSVFLGQGS